MAKREARYGVDRDELQPNLAAPSTQLRMRRARRRRSTVWVLVACMAMLSAIGGFVVITDALADPTESAAGAVTPGRAAATEALYEWLPGAGVPGLAVLAWDGVEVAEVAGDGGESVATLETHRFSLAADGGGLYEATLTVMVTAAGVPQVQSTPSLLPLVQADANASAASNPEDLWPGYVTAEADSDGMELAVNEWAAALFGGDPAVLRRVTGDPSSSHVYLPMSGAQSVSPTIVAVGAPETDETPDAVLVRVEVSVLWGETGSDGVEVIDAEPADGETSDEEAAADEVEPSTFTYDLLVSNPVSPNPSVQSWGGPGTGPSLTPYSVAVTGIDAAAPTPTPSPSLEQTEEPSDGEE